jgi:NADPH:quinone reductase-like Zn-dependent oxidoreductase
VRAVTFGSPEYNREPRVRALTIAGHGGIEQVVSRDDLPIPELREPADVRVRVHAAALNHLDLFVLEGIPGVDLTPDWVVGTDAAGIVESVGEAVRSVQVGDHVVVNAGISCRRCEYCLDGEHPLCVRFRVRGEHIPGLAAEYVVVPDTNVRSVPATIAPHDAAGFTLATLTAWRMMHSRARVQPGEDVLIWGIGGGVALAALQICKAIGARVWVTSSSDEKLERARTLGADVMLNHATEDVPRIIRERTGKRGMNVVLDNVGEATWERSLLALGRRGRLVTCGGTTGPMVVTDVRRLFWNQWSILGSTMGNDAEFDAVAAELCEGRLLPPVDSVWPLEEGRLAYERLASGRQFGKVVLRMGG